MWSPGAPEGVVSFRVGAANSALLALAPSSRELATNVKRTMPRPNMRPRACDSLTAFCGRVEVFMGNRPFRCSGCRYEHTAGVVIHASAHWTYQHSDTRLSLMSRSVGQRGGEPSADERGCVRKWTERAGIGLDDAGLRAPLPKRGDQVSARGEVAELLARAAHGDQSAWDEIVDRHTNLLWSIGRAHRLGSTDVADVVQTTWLKLLENIDRIREPDRLAGWLATTARHESLRLLRRSGREAASWDEDFIDAVPDNADGPLDLQLLVGERDAHLWRCFRLMSERCQRLLRVLMAVDVPSYAEISVALGLPIGSIGPTRMRCVRKLMDIVEKSGYPFDPALEGS
jgi:RNA polymerase sigma factor (sigma-70 family)